MTVEFRVLGTLEVLARGRVIPLPAGHSRVVLAGLLLHANEVVSVEQLVRWLWDGSPPNPDRAVKTIHMIMTRLRKALGEANVVATAPGGYVALVKPDQLDLTRFRDLTAIGAHAEALSLWRGPGSVLTDVASDSLHREEIAPLAEERLAALELRIDDDLGNHRHLDVVPELRVLTRQHPLREKFWAQLVLALYRADQQADALATHRTITRLLAEELGSTPGQELRDLHQQILVGAVDAPPPSRPVPRQLPPDCPHFVGRDDELTALGTLAGTGPMTIAAISGTAGVGKTTLAVAWAHAAADRFPDGQLFVNLRGFGPNDEPVRPDDALRAFLDAFEVPPEQIASTEDGRSAQFRSLLTDRKVLVLLDNARDAEQIRPLLPANPGCMVVVTSRNQLSGLVAKEGARPLGLATLPPDQAVAMLERHIGEERVQAEPDAVADLVTRCASLPLALLIVAARAETSERSLRSFADELADEPPDLGAVFSWSYRQLKPDAARLFRWLSLHPGREIGPHAIAALMGVPLVQVRRLLLELRRAHLVTGVHAVERYTSHDLLRAYANELCERHDSERDRRDATHRVLDYYLHCAGHADRLMPVRPGNIEIAPEHPPAETPPLDTAEDAMAWYAAESVNIVSALEYAAAHDWPKHAWLLNYAFSRYLWLRADWHTWRTSCRTVLPSTAPQSEARVATLLNLATAERQLHDYEQALAWLTSALDECAAIPTAHVQILSTMGATLTDLKRPIEAEQRYLEAITVARGIDSDWSVWGQAAARVNLGSLYNNLGRPEEAERELLGALEGFTRAGEKVGSVECHVELARSCHLRERFDEALERARTGLAAAQEHDSLQHQGAALSQIGDTLHRMGADGAAAHWERALAIFDEIDVVAADEVRAKLQAVRNV